MKKDYHVSLEGSREGVKGNLTIVFIKLNHGNLTKLEYLMCTLYLSI